MKRSGSRSKFMTCFRPVVDLDDGDTAGLNHSGFRDLPTSKSRIKIDRSKSQASFLTPESSVSNGILDRSVSDSSAFAEVRLEKLISDEVASVARHHRRKSSFSRTIKAALLEPMLSKRVNDRKSVSTRCSSLTGRNSMEDYESIRKEFDDSPEIKSSSASSSSSSSSSSSLRCPSPGSETENPTKTKPAVKATETHKPDPKVRDNLAVCLLLLVSLGVTVFGGKFWAVALTLICLYSLPKRRRRHIIDEGESPAVESRKSSEKERAAREYRKQRVVMEGILRRSPRRMYT
ncbi:hypothetical protein LINGRAHAP2_LOCUS28741 [Linum grandiflorum]